MFWGITISNSKKYSQTVEESYHISQAALEPVDNAPKNKFVSLYVESEGKSFLLCTLEHGKLYQTPLDLSFIAGEKITLSLKGEGSVHLTGYVMPEDDMYDDMDEEDMDSEMDDEEISVILIRAVIGIAMVGGVVVSANIMTKGEIGRFLVGMFPVEAAALGLKEYLEKV